MHFLDFPHGLGCGWSAGFGRGRRSGGGALAVGLALDHELVGAVAEAIQRALAQQRFIKDRHPFVHSSIRCEDRRAAWQDSNMRPVAPEAGQSHSTLSVSLTFSLVSW